MSLDFDETFRQLTGEAAAKATPAQPASAQAETDALPSATTPGSAAPSVATSGDDDGGEAVVSKNFRIMGDLNCHDVLRIDGYVEGNIECRTLTVSESARIKGNIRAKTVLMSGKVIGTIEAGTLTLNPAAMVAGDLVVHDQLGIEPGAHFEGSCKRASTRKANAAKAAAAKTAAPTANPAAPAPAAKVASAKPQTPTQNAPATPAAAAE